MASPDDLFVISDEATLVFTWVIYSVVCQIVNIFGIATNIINIICFAKQGFGDSVNISLLGLTISDLCSLIAMVWTCICLTPAVVTADLPFDPLDVMYMTSGMAHFSFTRVSGCLTAMITLERCLCITAPLKIKSLITKRRSITITASVFIIFFCSSAPVYVVNRLGITFSAVRNKTLLCLISTEERLNVEMMSFLINNFSIPFGAFVIIVVCTAILSFTLQRKTKWRQENVTSSQVDRVISRNQKAARMVVMMSTLFIVCFVPVSVVMLSVGFVPELSISGKYFNISLIIGGFGYLLESINSSTNIFIYYHMSSKYRDKFSHLFNMKSSNSIP